MTCCLYLKQSESNYDFSDVSQNKDLTVCTTPSVVILYTYVHLWATQST